MQPNVNYYDGHRHQALDLVALRGKQIFVLQYQESENVADILETCLNTHQAASQLGKATLAMICPNLKRKDDVQEKLKQWSLDYEIVGHWDKPREAILLWLDRIIQD